MGLQRFYADPKLSFEWPNGAIGYRPTITFDCLGPYAKVIKCPIAGTARRATVYATGYADTYFSIPAACKVRGKYIGGYLTTTEDGVEFQPHNRFCDRLD